MADNLFPPKMKGKPGVYNLTMAKDFQKYQDTIQLNNTDFLGKNAMLLFYTPSCPHCIAMQPVWTQLAEHLHGAYPVGAINLTDARSGNNLLADYFEISGTPQIKIYDKGTITDYTNGRTITEILKYFCTAQNLCDMISPEFGRLTQIL